MKPLKVKDLPFRARGSEPLIKVNVPVPLKSRVDAAQTDAELLEMAAAIKAAAFMYFR